MAKTVKVNLNAIAKVKLTKRAFYALQRQREYNPPKQNENGFSYYKLHQLMLLFGQEMTFGLWPFEPDFEIEIEEEDE